VQCGFPIQQNLAQYRTGDKKNIDRRKFRRYSLFRVYRRGCENLVVSSDRNKLVMEM